MAGGAAGGVEGFTSVTEPIRKTIQLQYGKTLEACHALAELDREIRQRNPISAKGPVTAIVYLHAKAAKTYRAILILAAQGYGEDALILARSLTNLAIDVAYLTVENSTDRVRAWVAYAQIQLRKWANAMEQPLATDTVDWEQASELAKTWPNIADRATASGTENFYSRAYRHGSIYEHSDAAGFDSFLTPTATGFRVTLGPSDALVGEALTVAPVAFAEVITRWAAAFHVGLGDAESRMRAIVETALKALPSRPARQDAPETGRPTTV